jgi:hypothetical protein
MASGDQGDLSGMDDTLTVPPSATAPGLLLRPWAEQDIPAMLAAHRDPAIRQWLRHPATTAEEAKRTIQARQAQHRAGTAFSFAVLEAGPDGTVGDLAGGVNLRLDREAASGEVGYWVTAPWVRARGGRDDHASVTKPVWGGSPAGHGLIRCPDHGRGRARAGQC